MTVYARIHEDWKANATGYAALSIIVSATLGAIAAMLILMHGVGIWQLIQLFVAVSVCMAHTAAILTVQKAKVVLNLLIASLVANILLIAINGVF